ncbi:hypothetical protein, partial [Escherichia coli]|uniref:hypothetical protein n=1 Tax=Escherichia coli TaxID=562 RepID=UPI0013B36C2F
LYYDPSMLHAMYVRATVDGVPAVFSYIPAKPAVVTFTNAPAVDAEIKVFAFTDFEQYIVGKANPETGFTGGIALSSGLRITIT